MARIRSIKPEFWTDYRMAHDLTRDQRLFYIGLWNESDDEGRFLAHPRRLLGVIFPYDEDLTEEWVSDSLRVLARTGRMVLYEVEGEPYGELTKFSDHQRINRPSPSRIPSPDNDLAVIHGDLTEPSLRARKEQGAGSREVEQGSSPNGDSSKSDEPISEMWEIWLEELGGDPPHPRWTSKRRLVLQELYREQLKRTDHPLEVFREIIRTVKRKDYYMNTRAYQMPESLFRNPERRDKWFQAAKNGEGRTSEADRRILRRRMELEQVDFNESFR